MNVGILGLKVGMTQIFDENGFAIPVTVIKAGPCSITQLKNNETDGYSSVQVGYLNVSEKALNKAKLGHLKKSSSPSLKYLKEYRVTSVDQYSLGQSITVQDFQIGQKISVSGRSIGKGFAGTVKRYSFTRGPMTHGSKNHREPGSIGQGSTPGRVFPGKKMAGRLGGGQITVKNLEILYLNSEENILVIKGSVPGKNGNLLSLR
jgi:large subunit ribosomal protein L3